VHGFGVIEGDHDVVVSFAGFGPSEPDAIFAIVGCDEGDDLFEVELFACFEIAAIFCVIEGFEDAFELFF
jgi:hypothetical protein